MTFLKNVPHSRAAQASEGRLAYTSFQKGEFILAKTLFKLLRTTFISLLSELLVQPHHKIKVPRQRRPVLAFGKVVLRPKESIFIVAAIVSNRA